MCDQIHKEHNTISSRLAMQYPKLYRDFHRYLQIGYYPFFIEDEQEYKNKLFNALDKIINEDIPAMNKIEYSHLSIFKKFIAKLVYAQKPFKVNIAALCKEFGVSHPTLHTYIDILDNANVVRAVRKYAKTLSKKPEKLLFDNPNLLYTFADEFGLTAEIGTIRETFFAGCFEQIFYSDIGDFKVGRNIYEIGGKNKTFKQIRNQDDSYLVIDTDYTMEPNKIPLWLFGLLR